MGAVVGEYLGSASGLGYLIHEAEGTFDVTGVFAGMVVLSMFVIAIDWLVTNYAKKNPIIYKVTPPDCPEVLVNIYRSYKSWLWNYKRKNFDPFRRGNRIFFTRGENDTVVYESTVGQLNFFYWAARYGVLDYAQSHIKAIEKDQAVTTKTTKGEIKGDIRSESKRKKRENDGLGPRTEPAPKKKRRQLSRAPNQSVFVYPTFINVVFNPKSD